MYPAYGGTRSGSTSYTVGTARSRCTHFIPQEIESRPLPMGAHQIYRSSSWLCNAMTRRRVHGEVGGIQATFLVGFTMLLPSYHAETRVLVLVSPAG